VGAVFGPVYGNRTSDFLSNATGSALGIFPLPDGSHFTTWRTVAPRVLGFSAYSHTNHIGSPDLCNAVICAQ